MVHATESTMLDKMALGIFVAAMIALVVCGCILTRKPGKTAKSSPSEPSNAI
jgi:hypothetical protein